MSISYKEFEGMDGRWMDDIVLIARIVTQYEESQRHLKQHGATFGRPMGATIK